MGRELPDRPIYCGNFEYDAEEREIRRLFEKFGDVDKIDMKTGFAFVYMRDKRDGDDAIRKLDRSEFGYKRRPLRVEWAKLTENERKRDTKPSTTLFVVNFDHRRVETRDVERHFDKYGRLTRVEIKKNYAFVQYDNQADATRALEATNGSSLMGRQIAVEYVEREGFGSGDFPSAGGSGGGGGGFRDDRRRSRSRSPYGRRSPPRGGRSPPPRGGRSPPRGGGRSPPRGGGRSPPPRGGGRDRSPPRRSPSPPRRARSPPRGRDRSPSYDR